MSEVTLRDTALSEYADVPARVRPLRDAYFEAIPEVCVERPKYVTEYHVAHGLLSDTPISGLSKARAYRHVLEKRTPVVWPQKARLRDGSQMEIRGRSLFAGSTTSKFKGAIVYPELLGLSLWPELRSVSSRPQNPYYLDPKDRRVLNEEVFPHWMDYSVLEITRRREPTAPYDLLQQIVFFLASKPNCMSHTIPSFSRAVHEGLRAVIDDAQSRAEAATDGDRRDFYRSLAEAMEGVVAYSRRLAAEADRLAGGERDEQARQELRTLAEIHRAVPERAARTFREALTTVWMCWTAIHQENPNVGLSLGRLDQLLYGHYRRDIDEGRLDVAGALELLCCLWLKIGDHVPLIPETGERLFGGTGSNQAITIGGVDRDGNDSVNDLTYVMLRATELMMLRDPNLNARYMSCVNSPEYLRRLCQANLRTGATPALHNDRAVIRALTTKGDSLEQARDYGIVGCVEPGSNGRHYAHSAAVLINLVSALELALFNGEHRHTGLGNEIGPRTGDPASFASVEQFRDALEVQIRWLAGQAVQMNACLGRTHQSHYPTPILSSLFEGPMDKGNDLVHAGATINSSGATIIGFADVVDSLSAIERLVFRDRDVPFDTLRQALVGNFSLPEHARLGERLRDPRRTPKFGTEDPIADANAQWLAGVLDGFFSQQVGPRGGCYRVGYWTMTNHAGFGLLMPAMPNGRRKGENFASGMTPVSGAARSLPEALNSVARVPKRNLPSGLALNIKFTPVGSADDEAALDDFAAWVEGYFAPHTSDPAADAQDDSCGMEIQFNIIDRAELIDALHHPDKPEYAELLVRVSGYTAYFKDLTPEMKQEIIERAEYNLAGGAGRLDWRFPLSSEEE